MNYQGVWQVEYRITACAGERHCDLRIGTNGQFLLRLSQGNDTHVTGVLAGPITVDAEGSVSPDGELTLTGASPVQTPQFQSVELKRFNARLTADASLSGTFEYVRPNPAQLGLFGNLVLGGEITGAVRLESTREPMMGRGLATSSSLRTRPRRGRTACRQIPEMFMRSL